MLPMRNFTGYRLQVTVIFLLLTFTFLLLTFPQDVFAQTTTQSASPSATIQPIGQLSIQSPQYANLMGINLIHAFSCLAAGISPIGQPCIQYIPGSAGKEPVLGALGTLGSGIGLMITHPPTSTTNYLATVFDENFGLIEPAHAQVGGVGNAVINPIVKLWQLSRNISYIALVIVLLVIGLMIAFRQRINQQTVVGAQQALPGVALALVLITFSYFIVALMIDFAFVISQLFGIVILSSLGSPPAAPGAAANPISDAARVVQTEILNRNIFNMFTDFILSGTNPMQNLIDAAGNIGASIVQIFNTPGPSAINIGPISIGYGRLALVVLVGLVGLAAGGPIGAAITSASATIAPEFAVGILLFLLLLFGLLYSMAQLFLRLIGAYVAIVLNTIFGPFLILFSAVPGRGNILTQWLRGLSANILIFPVTFGMFVLVAAILNVSSVPWYINNATGLFAQPLPLLGGLTEQFLRFILAYGILIASPGIPDLIHQIIAPTPTAITQATQAGIQAGMGAIRGFMAPRRR